MSRQLQSCRCSLEVLFLPGALWNFTMDFQPTFPRQISWGGSLLVMSAGSLAMTECFSAVFIWKVHSWGEIMLGIFLFLHRVVQHELPHTVTLSMHSVSSVVTSWEETIGTICACQSTISCQLRAQSHASSEHIENIGVFWLHKHNRRSPPGPFTKFGSLQLCPLHEN